MELLNEAKKQKDLGLFQYVWCQEGKVFVRDVESQPKRRITSLQDLERGISRKRNIDIRSPENDNPPSNPKKEKNKSNIWNGETTQEQKKQRNGNPGAGKGLTWGSKAQTGKPTQNGTPTTNWSK